MIHPKMRESVVLNKLRAGKSAYSLHTNFSCVRSVEMLCYSGVDCMWLCNEHVPNDYSEMEKQVLGAMVHNVDAMIRVPRGSYSDMIKPLEMNAAGVLVPHVMSAEEARMIARTLRFQPEGRRPVDGGNRDGDYCFTDFVEYTRFVNRNRFIFIQIEDKEAVDVLDEICDVPGIDGIFFGPGDYSHSIGHPGQPNHPEVCRVRELVAKTAIAHGKFAGTVGTVKNFRELEDMGYRFINLGGDVAALIQYANTIAEAIGSR